MNLETFFEKFALFADAPDAVAKLRELVLELAVRGQLSARVAKDQNDPAWKALPITLDAFDDGVNLERLPPFEIPEPWRWVSLGDLGSTKPRNDVPDESRCSFVPMTFVPAEFGHMVRQEERSWGDIKKGYTHIADGDVVMAKITPCFENGKSAVISGLVNGIGAGTTELHVFRRSSDVIDPKYALIYLKTRGWIERGERQMTGSAGQKRVSHDYFANWPFPLPPPAEQKRIVAKVDELMALCDRLEAQQQDRESRERDLARAALARFAEAPTPANLDLLFHQSFAVPPADLRKSILTLAVQGKLVPQDPNDQPAVAYSDSEALFEVPASWRWNQLGTLGLCRTGRTPPTSDPSNYGLGFPFIGPGQITPSGNITASEKTITRKGLENSTEAKALDILMVCIGGSIGKAAICREPLGFNQQINSVRLERDLPEFVYLAVTSEYFQSQVLANASGSATPIINKGKWERIPVPVPPVGEQRRIVAKVDELMALVDQLEAQQAAARTTAEKLLDAAVAELTTKD